MVVILKKSVIATVNVLYYMPDYHHIVQEFLWQTKDVKPEFPRIHEFLNFWYEEIDAVIQDVIITSSSLPSNYRKVDQISWLS